MLEPAGAVGVVVAQIDAYNARDLDKILTYYAPDAVIRDAADGRFEDRGLDAIRAVFDSVFAATLIFTPTPRRSSASGNGSPITSSWRRFGPATRSLRTSIGSRSIG